VAGRDARVEPAQVTLDVVDELMREQDGLLARRQALAAGMSDDDIRRLVRRRELVRVHAGVYVNHTGALTWSQRAWAAVLSCWPAALCGESALVAHGVRSAVRDVRDDAVIHVAVDEGRRVTAVDGVRVHRVTGLAAVVQPNARPHRVRLEHALLHVATTAADDAATIAVLADACQERRTTPSRLLETLRGRPNLRRRRFVIEVLDDVATGAFSLLEHRYLSRVERPHGLPTAHRQRRVAVGRTVAYRDVEYVGLGAVVELDGRLGHELTSDRWDDLDRDIDTLLTGGATLRLGWRHVLDPCRTAVVVARFLAASGWTGVIRACGPGCPVGRSRAGASGSGGNPAPGARKAPEPPSRGVG
jgi:hypothetical protein